MSSISLRVRLMSGIFGWGSLRKALRLSAGNFVRAIAAKLGTSATARVCSGETRWQAAHQRLAMISPCAASAAKAQTGKAKSTNIATAAQKRHSICKTIPLRHPPAGGLVEAEITAFDRFWQCQFLGTGLSCTQASDIGAPSAEYVDFVVILTHLSFGF
jgi:hypothetical protein